MAEKNIVQRITDVRIAVIGDVMTDVFVHGYEKECQDGCKKFVEISRCIKRGGAANAARSLEHWPTTVRCFGNPSDSGPMKTRFLVEDRVVYRHDDDKMYAFVRELELGRMRAFDPDAVLISDYDKGFLTVEFIQELIGWCAGRLKPIPCVADAKRAPIVYTGALLKCNAEYASRYECDVFHDVITRGAQAPHGVPFLPTVKCVNHVGAGDCFAAHLTLALACGLTREEAVAFAYSAGRVYVQHPHNRPPRPEEIAADMCIGKPAPQSEPAKSSSCT